MRDSSVGVKIRQPGDCGDAPVNAVYYDGLTNAVPIISAGSLVLVGGKSFSGGRGIGYDGPTSAPGNNFFKIPLDDILKGGSGARVRACTPSLKKKVRFKCCPGNCGESLRERTAIELKHISTCENPQWYTWVAAKEVFFECGCTESCCQKLNKLKAQFDRDLDSPVVATVVNVGDIWYLDLEAKIAGLDFIITAYEGLTAPDLLIPNFRQSFNAKSMIDWFPEAIVNNCTPDTCLDAVEIFYYKKVLTRGIDGTSNLTTDNGRYEDILDSAIVVFNPAVANSVAAKNALFTILTGTDERNKRLISTAAVDFPSYNYCIVRTDAGTEGNLVTVRTDYPTAVLSLTRQNYINGQSYYSLRSTSGVAPAPVTPAGGTADVVNRGYCGRDDQPCNLPDGCPEITDSACLNC